MSHIFKLLVTRFVESVKEIKTPDGLVSTVLTLNSIPPFLQRREVETCAFFIVILISPPVLIGRLTRKSVRSHNVTGETFNYPVILQS